MSTEVEEKVTRLRCEVERLRGLLAERRTMSDDATTWRKKIIAVTEHHRRLVRQLSERSNRLAKERAVLEQQCRRLQRDVAGLRAEKSSLFERWSRLQTNSLSRFLGSALERPPDPNWVRRLQVSPANERRLATIFGAFDR
jgi:predicted nuclease with TOPRIM domain